MKNGVCDLTEPATLISRLREMNGRGRFILAPRVQTATKKAPPFPEGLSSVSAVR